MINIRRARERGHANHGWLDSHHTFSFADYFDPKHMGFRSLRVINEDRVAAGQGFGTHPHRDMEIISWVLDGALEHRDSLGSGSVMRPGDIQRMSAGTGVRHSEFNASKSDPVHFLQIWIQPSAIGLPPGYEQKSISTDELSGRLRVVASPDGREGSVRLNADAVLSVGRFDGAQQHGLEVASGRNLWVQVARGAVRLNGNALEPGDGVAIVDESRLHFEQGVQCEVLVFDLA